MNIAYDIYSRDFVCYDVVLQSKTPAIFTMTNEYFISLTSLPYNFHFSDDNLRIFIMCDTPEACVWLTECHRVAGAVSNRSVLFGVSP